MRDTMYVAESLISRPADHIVPSDISKGELFFVISVCHDSVVVHRGRKSEEDEDESLYLLRSEVELHIVPFDPRAFDAPLEGEGEWTPVIPTLKGAVPYQSTPAIPTIPESADYSLNPFDFYLGGK